MLSELHVMPSIPANKPLSENEFLLLEQELKITKPRLAILAAFRELQKPIGAAALAKHLRLPAQKQATLYRTIDLFESHGILRRVNLRHNHVDYELADGRDHHHMVCTKCGLVEDIDQCTMAPVIKRALHNAKHFTKISDHAVELFGMCKTCAAS